MYNMTLLIYSPIEFVKMNITLLSRIFLFIISTMTATANTFSVSYVFYIMSTHFILEAYILLITEII